MFFIVPAIFLLLAVGQAMSLWEYYQMWQNAMDVSSADVVAAAVVGVVEVATAIGLVLKKRLAFYSAFSLVIIFVALNTWFFAIVLLNEGVVTTRGEWLRASIMFALTFVAAGVISLLLFRQHRGRA